LTILADQAIAIVGIDKKVVVSRAVRSAYWLNHDPTGMGFIFSINMLAETRFHAR
jgi:hypothetical protein